MFPSSKNEDKRPFSGPNTSASTEVSLLKSFDSNENQISHTLSERMQIECANMNVACMNVNEEFVSTCVSKNDIEFDFECDFELSCSECKKSFSTKYNLKKTCLKISPTKYCFDSIFNEASNSKN